MSWVEVFAIWLLGVGVGWIACVFYLHIEQKHLKRLDEFKKLNVRDKRLI